MGITETNKFSDELRGISLPVINSINCLKHQKRDFKKYITFTSFCAGWRNGKCLRLTVLRIKKKSFVRMTV